jgi:hypothetical protein
VVVDVRGLFYFGLWLFVGWDGSGGKGRMQEGSELPLRKGRKLAFVLDVLCLWDGRSAPLWKFTSGLHQRVCGVWAGPKSSPDSSFAANNADLSE